MFSAEKLKSNTSLLRMGVAFFRFFLTLLM